MEKLLRTLLKKGITNIAIICAGVICVIGWRKTNDLIFIIVGFISILGFLFNIYLFSRTKSKE